MEFLWCVIYLSVIGISGFLIGRILPRRWLQAEKFPYRCHAFEKNGMIYEKLGIKRWYKRVPDMSKIVPRWMPKKMLNGNIDEKLPLLIEETCVAELIHMVLGVSALYCLVIWEGAGGIVVTVLFELGNLPYILIQRYNRPRLLKLYQKTRIKNKNDRGFVNI